MNPMILTLIVFGVLIVAFCSNKISYAVISVSALAILQIFGVLTPAQTWSGFSDTSVVLFVALFILGGGLSKTSLITRMKNMLRGFNGKPRTVVWAVMGASIVLSIFTNSTVAVVTLIPIVISITKDNDKLSRTQMLKPAADMASLWVATFPLGLGAGTFMLFNSIVENAGGVGTFTIMDNTIAKSIPLIVCTLFQFLVGYKLSPLKPVTPLKDYGLVIADPGDKLTTLTPFQDKAAIVLFFGSIAGMVFVTFVPIMPAYVVAIICAILMVLTGVLSEKEAFGSVAWNIVFLYAGLLPLATALQISGAGQLMTTGLQFILGGSTNPYLITAVFFLIPCILTQFMLNVAVSTIFMTIGAVVCVNLGMDPRAAILAAVSASGVATMSVMASPTVAVVGDTGGYNAKSLAISGLPLCILYFITYLFTAPIFFPF